MKKIFILTLLLFAAAIFGIDKAAAQSMRLGIDGIEFTSVDEQTRRIRTPARSRKQTGRSRDASSTFSCPSAAGCRGRVRNSGAASDAKAPIRTPR